MANGDGAPKFTTGQEVFPVRYSDTTVREKPNTSQAELVSLLGNTALTLAEEKAKSELTGPAPTAAEALADDSQLPETLERDLSLSEITAAYKAGAISSGEANLRARAAVKRVIANNPFAAGAVRKRFNKFFSDLGGLGGVFQVTKEEKMQDRLRYARLKQIQDHNVEAQLTGITPEALTQLKQREAFNKISLSNFQLLEEEGRVDTNRARQAIRADTSLFTDGVIKDVQKEIREFGAIRPEKAVQLKNFIITSVEKQKTRYGKHISPYAPDGTQDAAYKDMEDTKQALLQLVDTGDLESMLKKNSNLVSRLYEINGQINYPTIATLKGAGAGDQTITTILQWQTDPSKRALIERVAPEYSIYFEAGQQGKVIGEHAKRILGIPTSTPTNAKVSDALATEMANNPDSNESETEKAMTYLAERAKEVPASMFAWNNSGIRAKVQATPKYQKMLKNMVNSTLSGIEASYAGTRREPTLSDLVRGTLPPRGGEDATTVDYVVSFRMEQLRKLIDTYPGILGEDPKIMERYNKLKAINPELDNVEEEEDVGQEDLLSFRTPNVRNLQIDATTESLEVLKNTYPDVSEEALRKIREESQSGDTTLSPSRIQKIIRENPQSTTEGGIPVQLAQRGQPSLATIIRVDLQTMENSEFRDKYQGTLDDQTLNLLIEYKDSGPATFSPEGFRKFREKRIEETGVALG